VNKALYHVILLVEFLQVVFFIFYRQTVYNEFFISNGGAATITEDTLSSGGSKSTNLQNSSDAGLTSAF
jgi:hypothetical protein